MIDAYVLPEGTEWTDFMTPCSADSPVGKGDVARILQYGVREGREASEDVYYPMSFYCKLHETVHIANGER